MAGHSNQSPRGMEPARQQYSPSFSSRRSVDPQTSGEASENKVLVFCQEADVVVDFAGLLRTKLSDAVETFHRRTADPTRTGPGHVMAKDPPGSGDISNTISGGTFYGHVIQGRDFYLTLPSPAPLALAQLPPLV